jgi:phosphoglycerate kinase
VLGGAKISDKIGVIEHLMSKVTGSALAGGWRTLSCSRRITASARRSLSRRPLPRHTTSSRTSTRRVGLHVPTDAIVSTQSAKELLGVHALEPVTRTVLIDEVRPDDAIYDIGPMTAKYYSSVVKARAPCSGMARWGCSKCPPLRTARLLSPAPLRTHQRREP